MIVVDCLVLFKNKTKSNGCCMRFELVLILQDFWNDMGLYCNVSQEFYGCLVMFRNQVWDECLFGYVALFFQLFKSFEMLHRLEDRVFEYNFIKETRKILFHSWNLKGIIVIVQRDTIWTNSETFCFSKVYLIDCPRLTDRLFKKYPPLRLAFYPFVILLWTIQSSPEPRFMAVLLSVVDEAHMPVLVMVVNGAVSFSFTSTFVLVYL